MAREPATEATSTRERLLTVAETLLLESGYDGVSTRAINAAAGVNPAAVHYHFGSKEALVAALLEARLAPLWQERVGELAARRERGWSPAIRELVEAVLAPLSDLAADPVGRLRLHLLARLVLGHRTMAWSSPWFTLEPWVELLRAGRPDLAPREAAGRWALAFDLILHAYGLPLADGPGAARVPSVPAQTLAAFVAAGLDAPAAPEESP